MSESNTLTILLPNEDSDRLFAEAKRRQIDPIILAQTLLHESLVRLNTPFSPLSQGDIELIDKFYILVERKEVLLFLERYQFIIPLLLEAHDRIRKHFPDSRLFLKYITDPEFYNPQLAIYITRPKGFDAEQLLDLLESFDDDWWTDAKPRSQGKIFIGYE